MSSRSVPARSCTAVDDLRQAVLAASTRQGFTLEPWIASGQDPSLVAGSAVWAQSWSRDPGFAPPQKTNLSDALAFAVCP